MSTGKRIHIELVPRKEPDIALYVQALLITVREQAEADAARPAPQPEASGTEAAGSGVAS